MTGVVSQELLPKTVEVDNTEFEVLARALLGTGLAIRFRAKGFSMRPLVRDGDALLVAPIKPTDVRVGDLVLFRRGCEDLVVHRVLKRASSRGSLAFLIKGDRAASADGLISSADVMGRVVARERGSKTADLMAPRWRLLGRVVAWLSPFLHRLTPAARGVRRGLAGSACRLGL